MQKKALLLTSATIFFTSAAATTVTAVIGETPNYLVAAGGAGLATAAAIAGYATATAKDIWSLVPKFALVANVPLTINGALMVAHGIMHKQPDVACAGAALFIANGPAYGFANFSRIWRPESMPLERHAQFSVTAGTAIFIGGLALRDAPLMAIGAGFTTEALLRRQAEGPVLSI